MKYVTPLVWLGTIVASSSLIVGKAAIAADPAVTPPAATVELSAQVPNTPAGYTVLHVNATAGNDATADGSQLRPYQTITHALNLAESNTLILLARGTYSADGGEVFPLAMKPGVTLQGMAGPNVADVVIQGNGDYYSPVSGRQQVTLLGADNAGLANVTVSNPHVEGIGLWIESGSPIVIDSAFYDNGAMGIYIAGSGSPVIRGNYFSSNGKAGLVIAGPSTAQVEANVFENTGTGITVAPESAPEIVNNRISSNLDGLIIHSEARPTLQGNQIVHNRRNTIVDYAAWTSMPPLDRSVVAQSPPPVSSVATGEPSAAIAPPASAVTAVVSSGNVGEPPSSPVSATAPTNAAVPPAAAASIPALPTPASIEVAVEGDRPTSAVPEAVPAATLATLPSPALSPTALPEVPEPEVVAAASSRPPAVTEADADLLDDASLGNTPAANESLVVDESPVTEVARADEAVEISVISGRLETAIAAPPTPLGDRLTREVTTAAAAIDQIEVSVVPAIASLATLNQVDFSPVLQTAESLSGVWADEADRDRPSTDETTELAESPVVVAARVRPEAIAVTEIAAAETVATIPPATATALASPDAIDLRVIPPPVAATTKAPELQPSHAALAQALSYTLETGDHLPGLPASARAATSVVANQNRLAVPNRDIPIGSGGNSAEVFAAGAADLPTGNGSPPPPILSTSLGFNFKVLVMAPDAATQTQLRSQVPDAFRTRLNGQEFMQAGAYPTLEEAQAMLNRLQQVGLAAQIQEVR